jgi:hypothetical protein
MMLTTMVPFYEFDSAMYQMATTRRLMILLSLNRPRDWPEMARHRFQVVCHQNTAITCFVGEDFRIAQAM